MSNQIKLSHYNSAGEAHMVDVSDKASTRREAVATAFVELNDAVLAALPRNPKGNPLEVARLAGIMAAKRTSDLFRCVTRSRSAMWMSPPQSCRAE